MSEQNLLKYVNVQVAPEALEGGGSGKHSIHVIVDKPKKIQESCKIQSFALPLTITVGNRIFEYEQDLLNLLWKNCGLSKNVPVEIHKFKLEKDMNHNSIASSLENYCLDPSRANHYKLMAGTWDFNWNSISCSLSRTQNRYYIYVHSIIREEAEKVVCEIMSFLLQCYEKREEMKKIPNTIKIYCTQIYMDRFRWTEMFKRPTRDMSTVYLPQSLKDETIKKLEKFFQSKSRYYEYGVTWKKVFLFEGPPATGKTTLALALASHFSKNLAKMSYNPMMTSDKLQSLFASIPENSFLLMEDIDALFKVREAQSGVNLDFSTFINLLDGVETCSGMVVFLTTNYAEHLDPALIRPGRVDCRIKFDYPGREEKEKALSILGKNWSHEHEKLLKIIENVPMTIATLQQYLFDCFELERSSLLDHVDDLLSYASGKAIQIVKPHGNDGTKTNSLDMIYLGYNSE